MSTEILLWRWSAAVQMTSAFMIAVFFIALSRSIRRPEVVWWRRAWIANLISLLIVLGYWYFNPAWWVTGRIVTACYMVAKTAFIILIIEGAGLLRLTTRNHVLALAAVALVGLTLIRGVPVLGMVQHGTMALAFSVTAVVLMRHRERRVGWFAAGLAVRASLAATEVAAYATQVFGGPMRERASSFVAASSSFDTGADWLIALGCLLMISERIQSELRDSNRELVAAQEVLRALADRDPLTGLANRRSLPAVLRAVQPVGATFLFFDLDGFKEINDVHGHGAGDECLRDFASSLQACFRPDDAIVRYGGDEFVVVASGLDRSSIDQRLEKLQLRSRVRFSVGSSQLAPGGKPEQALTDADEAMYAAKTSARGRRRKASA